MEQLYNRLVDPNRTPRPNLAQLPEAEEPSSSTSSSVVENNSSTSRTPSLEVVHIPREILPSPTPSPTSLAFTDSPIQTRAFPSSIQSKNNTSDDDLEANWGGDLE